MGWRPCFTRWDPGGSANVRRGGGDTRDGRGGGEAGFRRGKGGGGKDPRGRSAESGERSGRLATGDGVITEPPIGHSPARAGVAASPLPRSGCWRSASRRGGDGVRRCRRDSHSAAVAHSRRPIGRRSSTRRVPSRGVRRGGASPPRNLNDWRAQLPRPTAPSATWAPTCHSPGPGEAERAGAALVSGELPFASCRCRRR